MADEKSKQKVLLLTAYKVGVFSAYDYRYDDDDDEDDDGDDHGIEDVTVPADLVGLLHDGWRIVSITPPNDDGQSFAVLEM